MISHSRINPLIVWWYENTVVLLVSSSFSATSGISSFSLFELVRVLDFRLKWGCGIFSLKSTSRYEKEKSKFEVKRVKDIRPKLAPPFEATVLTWSLFRILILPQIFSVPISVLSWVSPPPPPPSFLPSVRMCVCQLVFGFFSRSHTHAPVDLGEVYRGRSLFWSWSLGPSLRWKKCVRSEEAFARWLCYSAIP